MGKGGEEEWILKEVARGVLSNSEILLVFNHSLSLSLQERREEGTSVR